VSQWFPLLRLQGEVSGSILEISVVIQDGGICMGLFMLHASGVFFITHVAWCVFLLRDAFFLLGAALFTSLYKHHEAAISLEHIYGETP
jgi:hypothetical protein